jgi:hypothetical protein
MNKHSLSLKITGTLTNSRYVQISNSQDGNKDENMPCAIAQVASQWLPNSAAWV